MKQTVQLKGLDCANCAMKIEKNIQNLSGVKQAHVDFLHEKMILEADADQMEQLMQEATQVIARLEPNVQIVSPQQTNQKTKQHQELLRILVAAFFFALFLIVPIKGTVALFVYAALYLFIGFDVIKQAIRNGWHGEWFDENFLMTIATLGAFFIHEYPEAVAVMLFYQVGEWFQHKAVAQSKQSITELMAIRPDYAHVLENGSTKTVAPEEVTVGAQILVKPGEKIPLDGTIVQGDSFLDTSALTGESVPKAVHQGDAVISGSINQNQALTIAVTKTFGESTVRKILDLVEHASQKKAPTEKFISKFARYYTPIVVLLAALLMIVPPVLLPQTNWLDWVYRGLTFLVISCPCALVISVPLSFFAGIGGESKLGVLVKGSNYLENLANSQTILFDKTGTLTQGVFSIQKIVSPVLSKETFLTYLASAEQLSTHPIAQSIQRAYDGTWLASQEITETAGYGVQAMLDGKEVLAGSKKWLEKFAIQIPDIQENGTLVLVAIDRQYAGYVVIADLLKPDAKAAIAQLQAEKRTVGLVTGDNQQTAQAIGKELGIENVYAELLPADKVAVLEAHMQTTDPKRKTAFVGDGMNDAPVLARADVGISMGALGSDAAIEAADIVIMNDAPSILPKALQLAKKTLRIVQQNIWFAIGVKVLALLLGAFGYVSMEMAVFADVGVTILAVLNAMRCFKIK